MAQINHSQLESNVAEFYETIINYLTVIKGLVQLKVKGETSIEIVE